MLIKTGKKQIDLTDYLKLKKSAFSNWKSGRNKSYLRYLPNIAEFFNVTVDYLLGKEEIKKEPAKLDRFQSDYYSLDPEDKETVDALIKSLLSKAKYKKIDVG